MVNELTERRIAKMARQTARVIVSLRLSGQRDAADQLAKTACEAAEQMRGGSL